MASLLPRPARAALLAASVAPTLAAAASAQPAAPRADARLSRQLDSIARHALAASPAPGISVAVLRGRDTLLWRGYGLADRERKAAAAPGTVYGIGSITKTFTAAAVMRLAEEGALRLDEPLARVLADYDGPGGTATVRHLLEHTSGIPSFTRMGAGVNARARAARTPRELRALFEDAPLEFDPGTRWSYNNSGYWLLGAVVEARAGAPFRDVVRARLTTPLGLRDTDECSATEGDPRRAAGYDGPRDGLERSGPAGVVVPGAAGSLCATVGDLVAWMRALAQGRAVRPESWARMTAPVTLPGGRREPYGLGLELTDFGGHRRVGHGGSIGGFDGYVAHYPGRDLTIAVLANNGAANAEGIEKRLARHVLGLPEAAATRVPLAAAERARYLGTYDVGGGRLQILEQGGAVRVRGPVDAELVYQGAHTFVLADEPDVRIVFVMEGERATALEWTSRGRTLRARRVG